MRLSLATFWLFSLEFETLQINHNNLYASDMCWSNFDLTNRLRVNRAKGVRYKVTIIHPRKWLSTKSFCGYFCVILWAPFRSVLVPIKRGIYHVSLNRHGILCAFRLQRFLVKITSIYGIDVNSKSHWSNE